MISCKWWLTSVGVAVVAGLFGCRSYTAHPLVPDEVLAEIEQSRHEAIGAPPGAPEPSTKPAGTTLDFARAAHCLKQRNPDLKVARAAFRQAWSLAETKTPLPNPEFAVGPLYGTQLDETTGSRVQPFVNLSLTIPLSGRLGHQDAVHRARAHEAQIDLVIAHRAAYLELRRLYADWVLARERFEIRSAVQDSAERSLALTRRLVDVGDAGALDVGLMELEVARWALELLDARREQIDIEEALATALGVATDRLGDPAPTETLPADPELPALEAAKTTLVGNHPELARERARYEVSEKELRLEVSKQYPDLTIGGSFDGDPGEDKKTWGLGVSIALPVFDRNQQGIVNAEKSRERVRSTYEAVLTGALAALEGAFARHDVLRRKHEAMQKTVLPRSRANLDVALAAIRAGSFDVIRYLETERAHRRLRIEAVDAELAVRRARADIEAVLGVPLGLFRGEKNDDYPALPAGEKREDPR